MPGAKIDCRAPVGRGVLVACGFSGPGSGDINGQPVLLGEAAGFLAERYAGRARDVSEPGGGDWPRAFSFRLDGRDLVARFGPHGEDFAKDQQAMAFAGPDLVGAGTL